MRKNSFKAKEHLKKNSEIKKVFDKGAPFKRKLINVYLLRREKPCSGINRVAFLVRKGLYNKSIVTRNRLRRILREAYRRTKHILPPACDIVLLMKNATRGTRSYIIEKELRDVFKELIKK